MFIIHWCLQLFLRNQGLSSVFHIQLMSRCAGAWREQNQAASPSWPTEIFHTIDSMLSLWMGLAGGKGALFFAGSSNPVFSGSLNFSRTSIFFGNYAKFMSLAKSMKSGSSRKPANSAVAVLGLAANRSLSDENMLLYIVCFAYFIIIINISVISISFVALSSCLYLNPRVSPFVHFSSPSRCGGEGGGMSEWLSSA